MDTLLKNADKIDTFLKTTISVLVGHSIQAVRKKCRAISPTTNPAK
ncbi:MAG: hypothetical protein ACI9UJ_002439 [bacterium]|jgi:hypothetical protein